MLVEESAAPVERFRSLTRSAAPPKAKMAKRKEMKKEAIFEDDDYAESDMFAAR